MKRLKIAEQLIIVITLALIVPMVVASIIVININQHAVRKELVYSATLVAESVYNKLTNSKIYETKLLESNVLALSYMKDKKQKQDFLDKISKSEDGTQKIELLNIKSPNMFEKENFNLAYESEKGIIILDYKIDEKTFLRRYISIKDAEKTFLQTINTQEREIYIINDKKELLMALNYNPARLSEIAPYIPKDREQGEFYIFAKIKNQPNIIVDVPELNWSIVVATPMHVISYGIINARYKIILSILIATFAVFLLCSAYVYSLYTNIRQLFKGINAISLGNYSRKIRLIKNAFTPYETMYLAKEFNKMVVQIRKSHIELQTKNAKLKKMDEYKSNLIDTVSHEFRTPLTSIKGYTSRLLRHDVQIDEETRKKSLKIIKQQSERLGRMVEDLLVIPDIESSTLRINLAPLNIKDIIETSLYSTSKAEEDIFEIITEENIAPVYADSDRLEQILVNLLENAVKYSKEDTKIRVNVYQESDFASVKVFNECEKISDENVHKLFGKFTRLDDEMTRTTRGTGLGLFIVKGLVEAMQGKISLNANDGFEITVSIPLYNESKVDVEEIFDDEEDND